MKKKHRVWTIEVEPLKICKNCSFYFPIKEKSGECLVGIYTRHRRITNKCGKFVKRPTTKRLSYLSCINRVEAENHKRKFLKKYSYVKIISFPTIKEAGIYIYELDGKY